MNGDTQDLEPLIRKALGPHGALLDDARIVELSANQNGSVFVVRTGAPPEHVGTLDEVARARIIRFCATVAGIPVTEAAPIVSTRMPGGGFRFQGVMPPCAEAPLFSIRFHAAQIFCMGDYIADGTLDERGAERLLEALEARHNIVLAGGTGSGKTTFMNMLIGEMARTAPDDRLVIIEDTPELRTDRLNTVFLQTSMNVDMTRLVAETMRLRPGRIIVGETRDGAALAMIKSWNTGHPGGLTSVHANSARAALTRLDLLIREASAMPQPEIIGQGVDLVVFLEATATGRRVREFLSVKGYEHGDYICE